jgi:hypothetical protein
VLSTIARLVGAGVCALVCLVLLVVAITLLLEVGHPATTAAEARWLLVAGIAAGVACLGTGLGIVRLTVRRHAPGAIGGLPVWFWIVFGYGAVACGAIARLGQGMSLYVVLALAAVASVTIGWRLHDRLANKSA